MATLSRNQVKRVSSWTDTSAAFQSKCAWGSGSKKEEYCIVQPRICAPSSRGLYVILSKLEAPVDRKTGAFNSILALNV